MQFSDWVGVTEGGCGGTEGRGRRAFLIRKDPIWADLSRLWKKGKRSTEAIFTAQNTFNEPGLIYLILAQRDSSWPELQTFQAAHNRLSS